MNYSRVLPFTGGGIVVGGLALSVGWLVVLSIALVLIGTTMVRLGYRRHKPVGAE